jgi:hypothetical protein
LVGSDGKSKGWASVAWVVDDGGKVPLLEGVGGSSDVGVKVPS